MAAPPAKSEISAPYPAPTNDAARAGFAKLWDYVTGLLGMSGNAPEARAALGVGIRGHLAGLTLSSNSNNTITIAAGEATDSANSQVMMLTGARGKDTAAWVVGNGGGLVTGTIAPNTWYHFYLIKRPDTGVVDVMFSLNATTPTLPANYTLYRRIGACKTDASNIWTSFVQDGDLFQWNTPVRDINVAGPGVAATLRILSVPSGVNVIARLRVSNANSSSSVEDLQISDPSIQDNGIFIGDLTTSAAAANSTASPKARIDVRTNASAQVRTQNNPGLPTVTLQLYTIGWIDRRGRDA